jgi:hypothetical protein
MGVAGVCQGCGGSGSDVRGCAGRGVPETEVT